MTYTTFAVSTANAVPRQRMILIRLIRSANDDINETAGVKPCEVHYPKDAGVR